MDNEQNYVFLSDAIGSSLFLQRLRNEGPYKGFRYSVAKSEIEKAEEFCRAQPNNLSATITQLALRRLRESIGTSSLLSIAPGDPVIDQNTIVVTNQDGRAIILQNKHQCKVMRFENTLSPYTGFSRLQLDPDQATQWRTDGYIATPLPLKSGEFVIFTNDGNCTYGSVGMKQNNGNIVPLDHRTVNPSGISPRNDWQRIMAEMLLSESRPISVIGARAGAGKTLIALACAMHLRTSGKIKHIIYVPPKNAEPPVPGDTDKKLSPYLYGLRDNLSVIEDASRRLATQATPIYTNPSAKDINDILCQFEQVASLASSIDKESITQTINALNDTVEQIRQGQTVAKENDNLVASLQKLLAPLANAQNLYLSLRQGDFGNFVRSLQKSEKVAKRAITGIVASAVKKDPTTTDLIKKYNVEVMGVIQLRSRSLKDTFVIIDEAQFLGLSDIDATGSRASTNSRITFLGDARQTYDLGSTNTLNGMLILTQTQMNSERASVLSVPPSVRSERQDSADFIQALEGVSLASIAESML